MPKIIKFRGIQVRTGEFIFGDLIRVGNDSLIYQQDYDIAKQVERGLFSVKPETVGQFTGLLDKNGKEIFEGDIVRGGYEFQDCWCDLIEEVKFFDCYFAPFGAWLGDGSGMLHSTSIYPANFEVIGNIYQNGDLIK